MSERTHHLKTWPEYFAAIVCGSKTFELHKNDRNFLPDDILVLEEWNPETEEYTGRREVRNVGYLLQGSFGLPVDVCVMSLLPE